MTREVSDLLAVLTLAKEAGLVDCGMRNAECGMRARKIAERRFV